MCGCDNEDHCGLRVKLQGMGGKQGCWIVMVGKQTTSDAHPRDTHSSHPHCKSEGVFTHGLAHDVKKIVNEAFPGGVRQETSAEKLLDRLHQFLINHKSKAHNAIASLGDKHESFKQQFRQHLKNTKNRNASALAASPFDMRELCRKKALHIPTSYIPRDNCQSAKELTQALGLSDPDKCMLACLGSGHPLKLCKAHQEKENKERTKKVGPSKLSQEQGELLGALVAFSPATLFKLLEGGKGPKGTRFRGLDGTHGCIRGHQLITHALNEFRHRDAQSEPTSSFSMGRRHCGACMLFSCDAGDQGFAVAEVHRQSMQMRLWTSGEEEEQSRNEGCVQTSQL
jgi:hypothetical protein